MGPFQLDRLAAFIALFAISLSAPVSKPFLRNRITAMPFSINQPAACTPGTFLLIAVTSSAPNAAERAAIRRTWASRLSDSTRLLFFLGRRSQNINQAVGSESRRHGDIIVGDFNDSYRNLTVKTVSVMRWVLQFCSSAKYILKSDDDMFINVKTLLESLHNAVHKRFLMGRIIARAKPWRNRRTKYYVSKKDYPSVWFPTYLSGTAYVISADLLPDLYQEALLTSPIALEDVFITGIVAQKVDALHVFNPHFGVYVDDVSDCKLQSLISIHG